MGRIYVRGPDGKRGSIDEADVEEAKKKGFNPEGSSPFRAAASQAISTATLGLADRLLSDDEKVKAQELRKGSPVAAMVGEAAGFVATAAATPAVRVGGTAAKLAVAFAENSLLGMGHQISEAALNNRPVNKELLAKDMFASGTVGAVLHGGGMAVAKGVSKVAGKAGELAADARIVGAAEQGRKKIIQKTLGLDDELYDHAQKNGFLAGTDKQSIAVMAGDAQQKAGYKATESIKDVVRDMPEAQRDLNRWVDLSLEPGTPRNVKEMRLIEKNLQDFYPQADSPAAVVGKGTVNQRAPKAPLKPSSHVFVEHADAFRKARAVREHALYATQDFDLQGAVSAGALAGVGGGPAAGIAVGGGLYGRHLIADRGGLLLAKGLEKIAEGKILPRVLKGFQERVEYMLATAPQLLGPFATVLSGAASHGPEALAATHAELVKSTQGPAYMARMGMRPESKGDKEAYGRKLAMLEGLETQRAAFDKTLGRNVDAFFAGKPSSFDRAEAPPTRAEFDATVKRLNSILQDPTQLASALPADILNGAPGLSTEAGQQAMLTAQFLHNKAPKPTDAWKPVALRAPFEPAPGDIEKWGRYAQAARDPQSVIAGLARGEQNAEGMETLKTLYPGLFQSLQDKVMAQLVALKKPLPYAQQQALASAFGPQLMGQTPMQGLYIQSMHQAKAAEQPQNTQGSTSNDGRQMVQSNKNMQTQTQRITARGQNNED